MTKLKKGYPVIVISGKCKNQTGYIQSIHEDRVIIGGVNLQTKNLSEKKDGRSEVIQREAPVHISNVSYYADNVRSKIGHKFVDNKRIPFARKTGKEIGGK